MSSTATGFTPVVHGLLRDFQLCRAEEVATLVSRSRRRAIRYDDVARARILRVSPECV
jgi:hypothetical protein